MATCLAEFFESLYDTPKPIPIASIVGVVQLQHTTHSADDSSLFALPQFCLSHILQFLDTSSLCSVSTVSNFVRKISVDDVFWRMLLKRDFPKHALEISNIASSTYQQKIGNFLYEISHPKTQYLKLEKEKIAKKKLQKLKKKEICPECEEGNLEMGYGSSEEEYNSWMADYHYKCKKCSFVSKDYYEEGQGPLVSPRNNPINLAYIAKMKSEWESNSEEDD